MIPDATDFGWSIQDFLKRTVFLEAQGALSEKQPPSGVSTHKPKPSSGKRVTGTFEKRYPVHRGLHCDEQMHFALAFGQPGDGNYFSHYAP